MVKYIIKINQSILTILNEKWEQKKYKQLVSSRPWSGPGLLPGLYIFGLGPLNLGVISRHSINIKPTHPVPRKAKGGGGDSDGFSR
jgi:hypothetical protein